MQSLLFALLLAATPSDPLFDDRGVAAPAGTAYRVVTLAPHLAELMFVAGAGESLVGTVAFSDFPEQADSLPKVGDAFRIDLERLVSLQPDLVIAWLGGNPTSAIEEVERLGIPVVALHAGTLDEIARHIRIIGALTDSRESAESAANTFEARLAELVHRYQGRRSIRVFYQISARPLFTVGREHSLTHAIALCGGRSVFDGLDVLAPSITTEAVLAADPEVIVGGVFPFPQSDLGELGSWQRWSRISAVRGGHLYQLDASIMGRPTPRILDGIEALCDGIDRARS